MQRNGKFIYRQHEGQLTRVLSVGGTDHKEIWEEIRDASVASGAYPLAFRAKELDRRRAGYTKGNLEPWADDPARFSYTAGGVLQKEPLGVGEKLGEERDKHWDKKS